MKLGVVGCAGRMGRMLLAEIGATPGCAIGGGTEQPGHAAIGGDAGALAGLEAVGIAVGDDPRALFEACDGVIDFTAPAVTVAHAELAAGTGTAHVIGTTGLDAAQEAQLAESAKTAPILYAPNMSVGVALVARLTELAAASLGPEFDIEVLEMHHRHKVDAPSGTALALGKAAAAGRGIDLEANADRVRDGQTGPRGEGRIGFATLRGGEVIGEHTVIFAGAGERIEIAHKAGDRRLFASGAVRAALWLRGKPSGLYSIQDTLAAS